MDALSTTRLAEGSISCSETLKDVWPYICRRPSSSEKIIFNLPSDQTPEKGSRHFSGYYLQTGAQREKMIPFHIQTVDE